MAHVRGLIDAVVVLATPVLPLLAWNVSATCTKIASDCGGIIHVCWIDAHVIGRMADWTGAYSNQIIHELYLHLLHA